LRKSENNSWVVLKKPNSALKASLFLHGLGIDKSLLRGADWQIQLADFVAAIQSD
jgi:hypothetical protein